jgi:hypothetical protein
MKVQLTHTHKLLMLALGIFLVALAAYGLYAQEQAKQNPAAGDQQTQAAAAMAPGANP